MKNQNFSEEIKQKNTETIKNNIGTVAKIKGSMGSINLLRKMYNKLCRNCQIKLVKNPHIALNEYCPKCQEIISKDLEKLNRRLK